MAKSASVIEINGNRYDAVSGQLVGAAKRVAAQVRNPASGVIDGLVRKPALSIVSSVRPAKNTPVSPPKAGRQHPKNPIARRQTQRSQTLMRTLVAKPAQAAKKTDKALKLYKSRTLEVSPIRAARAKTVNKNNHVNHFGKLVHRNDSAAPKPAGRTQAATPRAAAATSTSPALPSMVTSVSHQHLERMLDHALVQADAHKLALNRAKGWKRALRGPKWLTIGASSLAILLLAGFFAWQNIPQVSMRVADTRAHVSASVPSYAPMGYGVAGPIQSDDNQVTVNYKAADSISGGYAITQQASNWDSSSVAANAVPGGTQVQTSQVNGTTVYIYGNNNDATWVNHGVLFSLQDKANLNSDQILKIAGGL